VKNSVAMTMLHNENGPPMSVCSFTSMFLTKEYYAAPLYHGQKH